MAIRRRWLLSVMLVGAISVPALQAVAATTAADLENVDAKELPARVGDILKGLPAPGSVIARNTASKAIVSDFAPPSSSAPAPTNGIRSKRPEVRLNSAILISELQTFNSDSGLMEMLKSEDPAVRYHGAKGLGQPKLVSLEKAAGSTTSVIGALSTAAKKEKSDLVQQEIIKSLIAYAASDELISALEGLAGQMQTAVPEAQTLQTAANALTIVSGKIGAGDDALKKRTAIAAANLASFAIQQYRVNDKISQESGKTVPTGYQEGTRAIISAAAKAAGAALGKTLKIDTSSIDTAELDVTSTFGTPGGAGKQTGIPAPPVIKSGT